MENIRINPSVHTEINNRIIYAKKVIWNLEPADLIEEALRNCEGYLADNGAFVGYTGKFTGRSPENRYIVKDSKTEDSVHWGDINIPMEPSVFEGLLNKVVDDLDNKTLYIRDAYAGAHPEHRLNVRVINTKAWHNLFCHNMFIRPDKEDLEDFQPNFTIICDPDFKAVPEIDGTRSGNFAILNLTERIILIGGTGYTGEMKKGVFSVLNYILPQERNVLSMHCAANVGQKGDTALFFGLSGTGKTSLSTDPHRQLVGDDEHGWTHDGVFNFEGGCYAKVIKLREESEPDIFHAIRFGAVVENIKFFKGTRKINYNSADITPNTRVSYPIDHIDNRVPSSRAGHPKNIFFLTADRLGILPPISRLTSNQAMYHFLSGYTSKVGGTEQGVSEPSLVFSAGFGEPFLPLHPAKYAKMLGDRIDEYGIRVWLVNTGWIGGPYGVGNRVNIKYTRAMIEAALEGELDNVDYAKHEVFQLHYPLTCPDVPDEILVPGWEDENAYWEKANFLAGKFHENFRKYKDQATQDVLEGAPVMQSVK